MDAAPAPEGDGAVPTEEAAPAAAAGDAGADVAPAADPPAGTDVAPGTEATPAADAPVTTEADPPSAAEASPPAAAAAEASPSAEAPAAAEAAPAAESPAAAEGAPTAAVPAAAEGAPTAEVPAAADGAPSADAPAAATGGEADEAVASADAPVVTTGDEAGEAAATTASAADAPQEASAAEVAGDSAGSAAGADTEAPAAESADLKASPSTTELAGGYAGDPAASPEAPGGEHTTSSPREDAEATGIVESTGTTKVEVPDMQVDVTGPERPKSGILQAQEKLCSAVDGAMAEFGGSFQSEDPEVQTALSDWKARLESHVAELQSIMGQQPQLAAETTMSFPSPEEEEAAQAAAKEHEESFNAEVNTVRDIAHELESQRTGRDVQEVASAWADPEETNKEVAELRRVRRQIRYLFGGMIGSLPESTTLRVDDLLSDRDAYSGPESPVAAPRLPPRPQGDIERGNPGVPKAKMAEVGYQRVANAAVLAPEAPYPVMPSPRQSRPRSGGTESVDTATNSSVATWNSQSRRDGDPEEQRRRAERREQRRQHRNRHREHRADAPREMKKDDGAMPMPAKQWNWADEVVKASLDPGNQWEFPGMDDGRGAAARGPQWEQPRQRGADVVAKTRERAEEVLRSERDRKPNPYGMEVAAYR